MGCEILSLGAAERALQFRQHRFEDQKNNRRSDAGPLSASKMTSHLDATLHHHRRRSRFFVTGSAHDIMLLSI